MIENIRLMLLHITAPSAVRQVTVAEDGLRTVELSWMEPVAQNGVLKSYHVEYTGTHPLRDPVSANFTLCLSTCQLFCACSSHLENKGDG